MKNSSAREKGKEALIKVEVPGWGFLFCQGEPDTGYWYSPDYGLFHPDSPIAKACRSRKKLLAN